MTPYQAEGVKRINLLRLAINGLDAHVKDLPSIVRDPQQVEWEIESAYTQCMERVEAITSSPMPARREGEGLRVNPDSPYKMPRLSVVK